jgi:RNA-directed DNA polymerase
MPDHIKEMFVTLCTRNGETPQGAPTSPMITNMVMVPNDVAITKYCKEHDLVYTRYADDILISSRVSFDWEQVQQDIQNILQNYELKTEKTRYGSFNGRNWNLGLMYNNKGEITVGHKKKQLVKNMIHNYLTKPAQKTYENWYNLVGTVGYCAYIEPEYFEKYMDIIKANKPA